VDRCALFVDAGYALADGAMAVHGTRRRDSVSWDITGLLKFLSSLARDRTGLPVLRCYWYETAADGNRTAEHDALAETPGLKLRLVNARPGRREGIDTQLRRDLVTLAKNSAISDAFVASASENLAEIVAEVQDLGLRVVILHIASDHGWTVPQSLRQECDDIVEISSVHLRPFVELIRGAEPASADELYAGAAFSSHAVADGSGGSLVGAVSHQGLPVAALPAPAAVYPAPTGPDFQLGAQQYGGAGFAQSNAQAAYPGSNGASQPGTQSEQQPLPQSGAPHGGPAQGFPTQGGYQSPAPGSAVSSGTPQGSYLTGAAQNRMPLDSHQAGAAQTGTTQSAPALSAPTHSSSADSVPAHGAQAHPAQGHPAPAQSEMQQSGPAQNSAQQAGYQVGPVQNGSAGQPGLPPSGYAGGAVPGGGMLPGSYQNGAASSGAQHGGMAQNSIQHNGVPQNGVPQNGMPQGGLQQNGMQLPVAQQNGTTQSVYQNGPGQNGPGQGVPGHSGPAQNGPAQNGYQASAQQDGYQAGPPQNGTQSAGYQNGTVQKGAQPGDPYGSSYGAVVHGAAQTGFDAAPTAGQHQQLYGGPYIPSQANVISGDNGPRASFTVPYSSAPGTAFPPHAQYAAQPPAAAQVPAVRTMQAVAISLPDAVKAAHAEGFGFGESVGRDAPALWLDAVLARKPRMPSDLEARLLQGSALPIDSLLHDEVRHSLRRGFWDALENARR